jgi:antitoxin component HigA of HigAB toxin-antitoxin module
VKNNPQYVIDSLLRQLNDKTLEVANLESVIVGQHNKIEEIQKRLDKLTEEHVQKLDEES